MTDIGMVPGTLLFIVLAIFGCMALFFTWNHRDTIRFQMALFLVAFGHALCFFDLGLSVGIGQSPARRGFQRVGDGSASAATVGPTATESAGSPIHLARSIPGRALWL